MPSCRMLDVPMIPGNDNCMYVHLRSILHYFGYINPNLYLANAWGFLYRHPNPDDSVRTPWASGSINPYFASLLRLGFSAQELSANGSDAEWIEICRLIDEDIPVLTRVDQLYLPFWKVTYNYAHSVVVFGYSDDHAYVIDGWAYIGFKGAIPIKALKMATASENPPNSMHSWNSGIPIRNRYFKILPPMGKISERQALESFLNETLRLAEADSVPGFVPGAEGVYTFKERVESEIAALPEQTADTMAPILDKAFSSLGEVVLQRNLFMSFIEAGVNDLDLDFCLSGLQEEMYETARNWAITRNLCLKASRNGNMELISKIYSRLKDLAEREKTALKIFRDIHERFVEERK